MNQRKYEKVGGSVRRKAGSRAGQKNTKAAALREKGRAGGKAWVRAKSRRGAEGAGSTEGRGALTREALSWEEWAEQPLEGYDEDLPPKRERAFSRQTVYLVHKWLAEGMPLPMVARILNRSVENVRAASEVPLLQGEKALIRQYFCPFRMRKETD